jgi:class 3 adenylate cyclase
MGFVTVGNFGSSHRMDYTIIGGFVNLASRLCDSAKKNETLMTQETYMLVKKNIQIKVAKKVKAKGFAKLIQTYSLISLKNDKDLSNESNKALSNILKGTNFDNFIIQNDVLELLSEIKGVNDETQS